MAQKPILRVEVGARALRVWSESREEEVHCVYYKLELEPIQPHMAQKPVLRAEVGARALRVRSVSREEAWASAGV